MSRAGERWQYTPHTETYSALDIKAKLLVEFEESRDALDATTEDQYVIAMLRFRNAWMMLKFEGDINVAQQGNSDDGRLSTEDSRTGQECWVTAGALR